MSAEAPRIPRARVEHPRRERQRNPYEAVWQNILEDISKYDKKVNSEQVVHPGTDKVVQFKEYYLIQSELAAIAEDEGYSAKDRKALSDAIVICQMHQINRNESKVYRKKEPVPYANHPMEMARRVLEMRQDMKLVIACMLHDIPEDVQFGELLQTPEQLLNFIAWKFGKYDRKGEIVRIISAETKTSDEEVEDLKKPEVQAYLLHSGIGRIMTRQTKDFLRNTDTQNSYESDELSESDRLTLCKVIFDMCRMMEASFTNGTFDPRILMTKIMDAWQNLATDGFWVDNLKAREKGAVSSVAKLIRTRILINLAETLGYREVASEMTERLIKIQEINDIHIPNFGLGTEINLKEWAATKAHVEKNIEDGYIADDEHNTVTIHVYSRMPWGQEANENTRTGLTLYAYGHPWEQTKDEPQVSKTEQEYPLRYMWGKSAMTLTGLLQNEIGRPTEEFELLEMIDGQVVRIGTIRKEPFSSRWAATTRARHKNPIKATDVPERNIFHDDLTKYACAPNMPEILQLHGGRWLEAFPYFLSPRAYRRQGNKYDGFSFAVIVKGKLFLARNIVQEGSIWKICEDQGITPKKAKIRSIGDATRNSPWININNDPDQLTNIIQRKIDFAEEFDHEHPGSVDYFFVIAEEHEPENAIAA